MKKPAILIALLFLSISVHAQFFKSETTRKASMMMAAGDRQGAIAILDDAIAKGKDAEEAYQMRANLKAFSGDIRGAVDDLSAAIQFKPNDPQLYKLRAHFRLFIRDQNGALKDYDSAIANGLKTDEAYSGRADIKADLGDLDGAMIDYRNALAANPEFASAHMGIARSLEKKGESDNAILELQQFLDAYENKHGGVLPKAKMGNPTGEAVIIKREGKEPDGSQVVLGGIGTTMKINADNQQELDEIIRKRTQVMNTSAAFVQLGWLYMKKGDLEHAALNTEKGLAMSPSDGSALHLRSMIRIKQGDIAGAISDLGSAIQSPLIGPSLHSDKAVFLTLRGDDEGAAKEVEMFLQSFPDEKTGIEKRIAEAKALRPKQ